MCYAILWLGLSKFAYFGEEEEFFLIFHVIYCFYLIFLSAKSVCQ